MFSVVTPLRRSITMLRNFGDMAKLRATTIVCVRHGDSLVMIGDGQVSLGPTIVKPNTRKVRRLGGGSENDTNTVLTGFAGATADCLTLLDRLEKKIDQYPGQLTRACVELAKAWRTERYLRRLEVCANFVACYLVTVSHRPSAGRHACLYRQPS